MAEPIQIRLPKSVAEMALPLGIMMIIAIMIVPLPSILLDMFLAANVTISIIILMVSLYVMRPLDFSIFPTVLLITTLFRLSLNVASTRLILLHGNEGTQAAGEVIKAFGMFVVGGNYAVGLIVFSVLVIINFVVITKGAGRVAEVSARFTLDAMPGKQMAIDADLNAGLIREDEARRRRKDIAREADFYGAMDGASKFVRGDAVAGILITFINVIGGVLIGVIQQNMDILSALSVYTVLTVGDGLVAQVPALIVSTAAGIIVTRAASESDLGKEIASQIFVYPKAIAGAAGVLFILGLVPGLPHLAFLTLASVTGGVAYMSNRNLAEAAAREEVAEPAPPPAESTEVMLPDPLAMEVGYRLIPLVDGETGGELLERIKAMRKQLAADTGFLVPPVHIKDNLQLKPEEYSFILKGNEISRGKVLPQYHLAINPGSAQKGLEGIPTKEPAFGLPALWIDEEARDNAKLLGYTVVNPAIVIVTHLTEIIRMHANELLTRQDTQGLLDNLAKTHPKVVEELVPTQLSLGGVQRVLQNLLKERIPIRDMLTITETLANYASLTKDTDVLSEYVRQALSRTITKQFTVDGDLLPVMMMDPRLEDSIMNSFRPAGQGGGSALEPSVVQKMVNSISEGMQGMISQGYQPILMTSSEVRAYMKRFVEKTFPSLVVLSSSEVTGDIKVKNVMTVGL